jgi:hypothetical protein
LIGSSVHGRGRHRSTRRRAAWLVAALLQAVTAAPALAAPEGLRPLDRARVAIGPFAKDNDLRLRVDDRTGLPGDEFSGRRDLGLDGGSRETFREFALSWDREHQLHARRFAFVETGGGVLATTLRVGDDIWPIGAEAEGRLRVVVETVGHTWFPVSDDRMAIGVGLGLVRYRVDGRIDGRVETTGLGDDFSLDFAESAWAPQLGLEWVGVAGERWRVGLGAAWVRRPGGSVTGHAFGASARVEWFPTRHAGLALRWQQNDLDLEVDRSALSGRLRFRTRGPMVLGTVRF